MTYPILGNYFPSTYQKYVPQAFDNSLDLYEQMTALIAFLNGVVDNFNGLSESTATDITELVALIAALEANVTTLSSNLENEVLPENLNLILDEWFGSGKLATVINGQVFDMKINKEETLSTLLSGSYTLGSVVETVGFYTPEDGGGARYLIVSDDTPADGIFVHALPNGKRAKLVIENHTVNILQLGAKADYGSGDTDNFDIIQAAFDSEVKIIVFALGGYWINDTGKRLTTKRWLTIEGHNATILNKNGLLLKAKISQSQVTIKNLNIVSTQPEAKTGIGIEIAAMNGSVVEWGGCVDLENINVNGYRIGVQGDALYQTKMNRVISSYNTVAFHFISTPIFSNVNTFNLLSGMHATYGIVTRDFRNATFDNTTLEDVDYPFVVDGLSECVDFRNTWFELIHKAPVVFGTIDATTLVLTKSARTNDLVRWMDNRYSVTEKEAGKLHADLFFDPSTPFSARYKAVNKPNFDFSSLMDSGISYKNIAPDNLLPLDLSNGIISYPVASTPFGKRKIMRAMGVDDSNSDVFLYYDAPAWIPGHTYLLKAKVKTSNMTKIIIYPPATPSIVATESNHTVLHADGWTTVSTIVKLSDSFDGISFDVNGRVYLRLYEGLESVNVEAIEPMVVDLTVIFGLGNEPDSGLNRDLEKYFSYVGQNKIGRTGGVFDHSEKERIGVTLKNGWTGLASYRYLGNGLTEVSGELGTGTLSTTGTEIFNIPAALSPLYKSVHPAIVANEDPFNALLSVYVSDGGSVSVRTVPGSVVSANNVNAAVQFNFIISAKL